MFDAAVLDVFFVKHILSDLYQQRTSVVWLFAMDINVQSVHITLPDGFSGNLNIFMW